MKKIIAVILVISLIISGCAYDITKGNYEDDQKYYERINKVCENEEELLIVTKNSKSYKGKKLVIASDTTSFLNIELNSFEKITTDNISQIVFRETGSSELEGLLIGGLAGGLVANFLSNPATGEARQWKIISVAIGIAVGGFIGIIYRIIYPGNTTIFITKK